MTLQEGPIQETNKNLALLLSSSLPMVNLKYPNPLFKKIVLF